MSTNIIDWHDCVHMETAHALTPEYLDDYLDMNAIVHIYKTSHAGWMAVSNSRGTAIFFCPFCGKRLV